MQRLISHLKHSLLCAVLLLGLIPILNSAAFPQNVPSPPNESINQYQFNQQAYLDLPLVSIYGGLFVTGDPEVQGANEARWLRIDPFMMMTTEVTNFQFSAFIRSTGYRTDAERVNGGYVWYQGSWHFQEGAHWIDPQGNGSGIVSREDHPVVQVSQRDAAAFCSWANLRLPRSDEWEYAARGGEDMRRYPWGDGIDQRFGNFGAPAQHIPDPKDGYFQTAPVASFPLGVTLFGAYDMSGNVWEWTATPYPNILGHVTLHGGGWGNAYLAQTVSHKVSAAQNVGMDMVGFRCAGDITQRNQSFNSLIQ